MCSSAWGLGMRLIVHIIIGREAAASYSVVTDLDTHTHIGCNVPVIKLVWLIQKAKNTCRSV